MPLSVSSTTTRLVILPSIICKASPIKVSSYITLGFLFIISATLFDKIFSADLFFIKSLFKSPSTIIPLKILLSSVIIAIPNLHSIILNKASYKVVDKLIIGKLSLCIIDLTFASCLPKLPPG